MSLFIVVILTKTSETSYKINQRNILFHGVIKQDTGRLIYNVDEFRV